MKRCVLFSLIFITPLTAQPRDPSNKTEQAPPAQELATYLSHLNATGQLPEKKQEEKRESQENLDEEQKFQEAAQAIMAGMITLLSGAQSGDPIQMATGIFSMFSSAFAVATRSKVQDEEVLPTKRKRSPVKADHKTISHIKSIVQRSSTPFAKRAK